SGALRLALFEAVPVSLLMIALAEPIVALLFQRGRFDHQDTLRAAHVLRFYGLGMWAFCTHHIILRAFYSLQDQLTPLRIAASLVAVNFTLNLALIWQPALREAAFGLSSAITSSLAVIIGLALLTRRFGTGLDLPAVFASLARILLAAIPAALAAWIADSQILQTLGPAAIGTAGKLARGLLPLTVGVTLYLLLAWLMRMPELHQLLPRRPSQP
ncbi:MAG: lipid II flippase MurJ, partial [Phycisphaerae bacterium]